MEIKEIEKELPLRIKEDLKKNLPDNISESKKRKIYENVFKEFLDAKVEPGEAVGLVSAESIGEPGTQMCLAYDERVLIKHDDRITIVKLGEFADTMLKSGNIENVNGYDCTDAKDIFVLALNDDEKLEWKAVSKINRIKSPEKLMTIRTKSGRRITATDFHSFVTRKGNKIVSIAGKDLKKGHRIPSIKYLPENCIEAVPVYEYIDYPKDDFRVQREYRPTKILPTMIDLDWNSGWFIGAYLAEGCAPLGQLCISNIDDNYIINARRFVSTLGFDYVEKHHSRGFSDSRDFIVNSSLLARFMRNVCGNGSSNKRVPEFSFSAKEEFVAGLLRGYFDGDGNISVDRKMIRVSSNSEELLDGIKLLLTRFGIFAFKSKDHKQHYLVIPYKYAPVFLEKIGSDIRYKKDALSKLAECAKTSVKYQDYNDMISGFDTILVEVSRKLRLPSRFVNSATKRQKIGRTVLMKHIARFETEATRKGIDIYKELAILKKMAYSDIVWDEIEKIEYVNTSHNYVYDLTVPGLHTFTTFDGIVVHNTLNTFHFAGVAEMNVTVGLPRIIEILDGRSELSTPMMEIYLKSPYNKSKEIRKLALSIKETMLKEIVTEFKIDIKDMKIEALLDKEKIKEIGLSDAAIEKALQKNLKGFIIKTENGILSLKSKKKDENLNEIYRTKEKIKDINIKGVKEISQVLPVLRGDEYVIITAGSNFSEILQVDFVDDYRTLTNNIFEISKVLGIEAARQVIINEVFKVIESQGLNVDIRHIMLVADTMCMSGEIKGITRYGVVSEKSSVLARASFETPIKHIVDAALIGEIDNLNSVVENVMLNQPVPIGTGLPGLLTKVKNEQ